MASQVSVAVLLDNFLTASKDIKREEDELEYNSRRKAGPVRVKFHHKPKNKTASQFFPQNWPAGSVDQAIVETTAAHV